MTDESSASPPDFPQPVHVDVTTDDALGTDDLTSLLDRVQRGDVSAAELRTAARARVEAANRSLNAVAWWVDESCAFDVESSASAPLAGIPTLVKDNENLVGFVTTEGSYAMPSRPATQSSPWVRQFLELGVRPIAKTTLPEFGLTATTESTRFGATRNPWNVGYSAGGSSGGSASLVAAGVVPLAHANDGGGSIRIPASVNGLVGLKPSRGRLIDAPELDRLPVNLTVQGVVTRTVRDTALYYSLAEQVYRNPALPEIGMVTGADARRLRIGVSLGGLRNLPVSAETIDIVHAVARTCESLGHHVDLVNLPVADQFGPDFLRYWAFLSFTLKTAGRRLFGEGFDGSRTEILTAGLASMFVREAERLPGSLRRLRKLAREGEPVYQSVDVLLSPVLGHAPPRIGYLGEQVDMRTHLIRLLPYTSFTPVQNVSGAPAMSLPLGRSASGLPIGVQLAAPLGQERRLLSLAYELEEATPWPTRVTA